MTVQAIASQTSSDYLFWNVPVALSTNMMVDSASPDREKCGFTSDVGASFALVNQLQRQLSGVAVPSENASRLIADVWGVQDGETKSLLWFHRQAAKFPL